MPSLLKVLWLSLIVVLGVQAQAGDKSKIFNFRLQGESETLDWNRAHTPIESHLLVNLMEGLVTLDPQLKVVPALAENWKVSQDGKTYTFKLRKGVKWSDGVPLKAEDFVYSWKRLLTPETAAAYAYFLFDIQGAEEFNKGSLKDFAQVGVKALDSQTVQVKLKNPVAYWLHIPSFWVTFPVRQDVVEQKGVRWVRPENMVTVGPFTLAAHEVDTKIVLRANPYYYGGKGNVSEAVGYVVSDNATALKLYENGKLDFVTDLSSLDLSRMKGRADLQTFPYLKTVFMGFEVGEKKATSNVSLRRAIAMAVDKTALVGLFNAGQKAATSFVPPPMSGAFQDVGLPYDVKLAKREFETYSRNGSQKPSLELIVPNWERSLVIAEFIQAELKKNLGLEVGIQPFDNKTYRAQLDLHKFPIYLASWSADYPDPDNYLSVYLSGSGNNRSGWKSPAFDQQVLEARSTKGEKKRAALYRELQKQLLEKEAVMIPLFYEPNTALVKSRVKNLELNPLNYHLLRKVILDP